VCCLVSRAGSVSFKALSASYKNFKEKFFKVFVEPPGTRYFFDEVGQQRFPLFWTRSLTKIKDWPRSVNPNENEWKVFALFDSLTSSTGPSQQRYRACGGHPRVAPGGVGG